MQSRDPKFPRTTESRQKDQLCQALSSLFVAMMLHHHLGVGYVRRKAVAPVHVLLHFRPPMSSLPSLFALWMMLPLFSTTTKGSDDSTTDFRRGKDGVILCAWKEQGRERGSRNTLLSIDSMGMAGDSF